MILTRIVDHHAPDTEPTGPMHECKNAGGFTPLSASAAAKVQALSELPGRGMRCFEGQ